MKKGIIAALLAASPLVFALPADAQGAAQSALSPAEIVKKVESEGYTNVHDVEFDDGRWELEATSPAGKPVDLAVDASTGKIVHEEND